MIMKTNLATENTEITERYGWGFLCVLCELCGKYVLYLR
jgi:hypothetical protein